MKKHILALLIGTSLSLALPALAQDMMMEGHDHEAMMAEMDMTQNAPLRAALVTPEGLKAGQDTVVTLKLTAAGGAPVTLEDLQEVHTRKVHWLVVDETLGDYHHLHPEAGAEAGTYSAHFTPKRAENYKIWVDITPVKGPHQYIPVTLKGEKPCHAPCAVKTLASGGEAGGLKAHVSFDTPLTTGVADRGKVTITDKAGNPVKDLEPVMGAFAHIVAFYDDFETVAHVHPMGKEPTSAAERGGPDLTFHLEPEKAGFLKMYVQIKRQGQDIFIPLGVEVVEK